MIRDVDPVLDAVPALRAIGITVAPIGGVERWQIGHLILSDADVLRLAESRGLVEAA
ncbi:hypothetical protein MKK88_28645 [Methylobacterium sp. E-005]|uniref:hypothetical protein n=1 Tax=Methylobacterium sp. E-005 TaxID=2836549 RepID=UPI001FBA5F53|nr:hypothetical protein [Methylobacterium sp. E-005]MCJ2089927.1 hypothetical protein [Methylobacterium sp. E-005]